MAKFYKHVNHRIISIFFDQTEEDIYNYDHLLQDTSYPLLLNKSQINLQTIRRSLIIYYKKLFIDRIDEV